MNINEVNIPVGTIVIVDDNGEVKVLRPEDKKKQKRLAKKNLLKIINLLTFKEKQKMLKDTVAQVVGNKKKPSMGIKEWVINNIPDKSRFYSAGLLVPSILKAETIE